MKYLFWIAIILVVFGCTKDSFISEQYEWLLGEWMSVNSTKKSEFTFKSNGKVSLMYEAQRGKNFRVINSNLGYEISLSGEVWDQIVFEVKNTDSSIESLLLHSTTKDTIMYGGIKYIRK